MHSNSGLCGHSGHEPLPRHTSISSLACEREAQHSSNSNIHARHCAQLCLGWNPTLERAPWRCIM